MPIYNLIEYSGNYSKTSGILWQYCRYELAINAADGNTVNFNADNASTDSFQIKEKITGQNKQQWHKKCWNNGTIKISK